MDLGEVQDTNKKHLLCQHVSLLFWFGKLIVTENAHNKFGSVGPRCWKSFDDGVVLTEFASRGLRWRFVLILISLPTLSHNGLTVCVSLRFSESQGC